MARFLKENCGCIILIVSGCGILVLAIGISMWITVSFFDAWDLGSVVVCAILSVINLLAAVYAIDVVITSKLEQEEEEKSRYED